jgi:acyl-CoA thioester hydrolase
MKSRSEGWTFREHEIRFRVRYQETDGQGRAHHANYLNYFETGRIEFLRSAGYSYRELEAAGVFLVVRDIECHYLAGARFDDELTLKTFLVRAHGVRIEHRYELRSGDDLVATGRSVVASVDRAGKVCRLPKFLRGQPA